MKSFKILAFALSLIGFVIVAPKWGYAASPFQVTVGTTVPNGATNGSSAFTAAGFPIVTGTVRIRKIQISNDGAGERVTLWKNCTSSSVATAVWDWVAPIATGTTVQGGNISTDWLPVGMTVTSPCIHKGVNAGGTIKASFSYE